MQYLAYAQKLPEFQRICSSHPASNAEISWVHLHENEQTAIRAVESLPDSAGFCLTSWKHAGTRNAEFTLAGKNYRFDPNRIYTAKGIEASLRNLGNYSVSAARKVEQLAQNFIAENIDGKKIIVALHNNTPDGGLHINAYASGSSYAKEALKVHINHQQDPDNFFFTTSSEFFDFLQKANQNVVLQNNAEMTDDGSLSVYCGIRDIPYLNIEAEHQQVEAQREMILLTLKMFRALYPEQIQ